MISDFILNLLAGLVTSLSGIITTVGTAVTDLASIVATITNGILGIIVFASPVIDPSVLTLCVSITVLVLVGDMLFRIGNWIFNKIPEIAGFGWQ